LAAFLVTFFFLSLLRLSWSFLCASSACIVWRRSLGLHGLIHSRLGGQRFSSLMICCGSLSFLLFFWSELEIWVWGFKLELLRLSVLLLYDMYVLCVSIACVGLS